MNTLDKHDVNRKSQDHRDPSTQKTGKEERNQREPVPPKRKQSSPALREAAEGYLQKRRQKVESDQLSDRTVKTDRRSLELLLEWVGESYGGVSVAEAVDIDLREFKEYRSRSVSPTTVAKDLRHIKSFFSDLLQRGVVNDNPAMQVDIPQSRTRDVIPKKSEFKALKAWLDGQIESREKPKWIHLLMKLACHTGMRLGELIQVKWQRGPNDVGTGHARNYVYLNSEEKTLKIKFKRKARVIPVDHVWSVFEALRNRQEQDQEYVFASPNGGHYDDSYVCNCWKKEIKKVEALSREYTCHSIRHAVVTSLLRSNFSTHKVGQFVGHSSEQITERYAHLIAGDLSEMANELAGS